MSARSDSPSTRHLVRAAICAAAIAAVLGVLMGARSASAQEPPGPQPVSQEKLQAAIDQLGNLDYDTRTSASRTVRRTPGAQAVPALLTAVASHKDGYVRYRALVLLTGFDDPRTHDAIRESLASPNDRLRTVAYSYFEHNPDPAMIAPFLAALDKEVAEFVRPALIRALAALGNDPRVQSALVRESGRGEDFFRSAVIEALGDYKARYAVDALLAIAKLDGPLADDAALALGKIGDRRVRDTLIDLQHNGPPALQPFVVAALCLIGDACAPEEKYLVDALKYSGANAGNQELLRGAAAGLGALGVSGRAPSLEALFDAGIPSDDPMRAPIALAVATVALRNTPLMLTHLGTRQARAAAIDLMAEGFDMLEEDLDKERFFVLTRHTYWEAPDGSPTRALMQTLIGKLDF